MLFRQYTSLAKCEQITDGARPLMLSFQCLKLRGINQLNNTQANYAKSYSDVKITTWNGSKAFPNLMKEFLKNSRQVFEKWTVRLIYKERIIIVIWHYFGQLKKKTGTNIVEFGDTIKSHQMGVKFQKITKETVLKWGKSR